MQSNQAMKAANVLQGKRRATHGISKNQVATVSSRLCCACHGNTVWRRANANACMLAESVSAGGGAKRQLGLSDPDR